MALRGCSYSHFIWSIRNGVVEKVHNMDSHGKPSAEFKRLEEIYHHADVELTSLRLAERETRERNSYVVEEYELNYTSKEISPEEMTLSQIRKKLKRKRRKASESVLLVPKAEDVIDLTEPLCNFRVKVSKRSQSKRVSANGDSPTSSKTQLVTSEISKDLATVKIKIEDPEVEYFESSHDPKRGKSESLTNEPERCEFNQTLVNSLDDIKKMEMDDEETIVNVNQSPSILSFLASDSLFKDSTGSASDCSQSKFPFQQTVDKVSYISVVEDSDPKIDDDHDEDVVFMGAKPPIFEEQEKCELNEAFFDSLDDIESMEMDNEEFTAHVKEPSSSESDCFHSQFYLQQTSEQANHISAVEDSTPTLDDHGEEVVSMEARSPISEENDNLTSINADADSSSFKFDNISLVSKDISRFQEPISTAPTFQDSTPTLDDNHGEDVVSMGAKSSISEEHNNLTSMNADADSNSFNFDNISLVYKDISINQELISTVPAVQDSTPKLDDEHGEDVVSMEAKSPISEEIKNFTSVNSDADSNSFNSYNVSSVSKDISIPQELISTVPANAESEVKFDHNDQTGVMSEASDIRQPERLPLTRKFISPNSQEKLCQAMKSEESLDDMDHFKCKEKLYFGEQTENTPSLTKSDDEDNELNIHLQQDTQFNKAVIISKQVLKRPRNNKKVSPTKKGIAPKGCLDGPRLCRSIPRLSSGCTSIEGCSESAIAFSQRQMHDIESLASKLMSELNSMKVIVEEKMLYEAYRSTSLKNEADEVKSAIKSAIKTEETAKKWLSMMARDCNRFCKIMKLNEDHNTSASADPALSNNIHEKPLEREKKKISFADEAGGTLCDIKIYQIEQELSLP